MISNFLVLIDDLSVPELKLLKVAIDDRIEFIRDAAKEFIPTDDESELRFISRVNTTIRESINNLRPKLSNLAKYDLSINNIRLAKAVWKYHKDEESNNEKLV